MFSQKTYIFKLYLSSADNLRAAADYQKTKNLLSAYFTPAEYELILVDVFKTPYVIVSENIISTPTLRRLLPRPEVEILSQITETEFLETFNINPAQKLSNRQAQKVIEVSEQLYVGKSGKKKYHVLTMTATVVLVQNIEDKEDIVTLTPAAFASDYKKFDPDKIPKKSPST